MKISRKTFYSLLLLKQTAYLLVADKKNLPVLLHACKQATLRVKNFRIKPFTEEPFP